MAKHLLTVEDALALSIGVLVSPGPLESEYSGAREMAVELRLPTGETRKAVLRLESIRYIPRPAAARWGSVVVGLTKEDVPIGTEIWVS